MTVHLSRWPIPLLMTTAVALTGAVAQHTRVPEGPAVVMYKSASCTCCPRWGKFLVDAGFTLEVRVADDLSTVFAAHGIAPELRSCHLATIDGYTFVGHVPIADVQRVLREHPNIAGLAVPGMPATAPGMDLPGAAPSPYEVVAFDRDGRTSVYARH